MNPAFGNSGTVYLETKLVAEFFLICMPLGYSGRTFQSGLKWAVSYRYQGGVQ